MIEVEVSLLEAKGEGGVEGEVLGKPWDGCGFTVLGPLYTTNVCEFCMFSVAVPLSIHSLDLKRLFRFILDHFLVISVSIL